MTSLQSPLDHLDFPDGAHINVGSHRRRLHRWSVILEGLERCTSCGLRRFQLAGETVWQRKGTQGLWAGAEPRCGRRAGR